MIITGQVNSETDPTHRTVQLKVDNLLLNQLRDAHIAESDMSQSNVQNTVQTVSATG